MEKGNLVALYCSDVSGAFDRVDKRVMHSRLCSLGIPRGLALLLESWLADRKFMVVVENVRSRLFDLRNSVFQGTV